jgi:predicted DCC family thiol-disulfide oxidoreductase YuxK
MSASSAPNHPVVLFDGVCNLCNAWVNFVIDRDPASRFRFASLQSEAARSALDAVGRRDAAGPLESILLIDGGRLYERSAAVLRIVRHLSGPWWLLGAFVVVPRPIRDAIYRWVAANRYRWFGKSDVCRVPTPELRERFLEPL